MFDFCEHDLAGLLSNVNVKFSLGEVKKVMQQLLNGLYYIHSNKVSVDSKLRVLAILCADVEGMVTRLRHCATSWKVAGLIPVGVIGIFH